MKVRAGDTVVVITGKDKGRTGQVLRVLKNKGRIVVADINMRTRHMRKTPNRAGEIVKYEASIDASNVMVVDPKSKKRSRVGYKIDGKGKKTRIFKRSGDAITKTAVATKKEADKTEKTEKKTEKKGEETGKKAAQPFWKKMGFGAEAMEDTAEVEGGSREQSDHSVPDQTQRSSARGASRGS